MKLKGATVLVTGGAVRIGRAICEALAARGCNVVIHCRRSKREARELAARLGASGVRAFVVSGDLAAAAGCRRVMREAARKAGKLDALVNNAAVFYAGRLSARQAREQSRVNREAPMLLTKAFAVQTLRGKVVNLLDQRIAGEGTDAYSRSKKELADYTVLAALELAPRIAVNGVAPGPVLPPAGTREKAGRLPLKRRPSPADVASAVVFLLENNSITGQIIFVDGGQHLLNAACPP